MFLSRLRCRGFQGRCQGCDAAASVTLGFGNFTLGYAGIPATLRRDSGNSASALLAGYAGFSAGLPWTMRARNGPRLAPSLAP
jgi:hypothetical protein